VPRRAWSHASQPPAAGPDTSAVLVNRRLLRVEEAPGYTPCRLTSMTSLCGVVKRSRDQRQEREARESNRTGVSRAAGARVGGTPGFGESAPGRQHLCRGWLSSLVGAASLCDFHRAAREAGRTRSPGDTGRAEQARGQAEHLWAICRMTSSRVGELGSSRSSRSSPQRQIDLLPCVAARVEGHRDGPQWPRWPWCTCQGHAFSGESRSRHRQRQLSDPALEQQRTNGRTAPRRP